MLFLGLLGCQIIEVAVIANAELSANMAFKIDLNFAGQWYKIIPI